MKEISKKEFSWLYENYFKNMRYPCWVKTCKKKRNGKRGKYYVQDKYYNIVKQQNIV